MTTSTDSRDATRRRRFASLHQLVGDTPLLAIELELDGHPLRVFAKHEAANFTGSIKDRMVLHLLEQGYARGELEEGDLLVEATSGNTGIALAAIGQALGHQVRIYMPDWMSRERVDLVRSLGATIVPVSAAEGGFRGSIALADEFAAAEPRAFRPQQFDNLDNVSAHALTTAPELLEQLRSIGLEPTAFVAGVGTGGTVMGVGRCLREQLAQVAIHPLEPANSPTLRTGKKVGKHRIQGIGDEFVPKIVDLDFLDSIEDVWDGDGILMAQALAARLGLGVGISSGANLVGAIQVAAREGPDAVVATVLPDSNARYLSTDLLRDEEVRDGYLAPRVRLTGCTVIPRRSALATPPPIAASSPS